MKQGFNTIQMNITVPPYSKFLNIPKSLIQDRPVRSFTFSGTLPEGDSFGKIQALPINAKDNQGRTLLHQAVLEANVEVVEKLLATTGIEVNAKDNLGKTPLALLTKSIRPDFKKIEPQMKIFELLLAHPDVDVNVKDKEGSSVLLSTWFGPFLEKLILHPKLDVNLMTGYNGSNALISATLTQKADKVKTLLSHPKIDVNLKNLEGLNALYWAFKHYDQEISEMITSMPNLEVNGAFQKHDGQTALMLAVNNSEESTAFEQLLNRPGVEINAKDDFGLTALSYLMRKDTPFEPYPGYAQFKMIDKHSKLEKLLSYPGIDVNVKDIQGRTPLMHALIAGNETLAERLLFLPGIQINERDQLGMSAVSLAAIFGYTSLLQKLSTMPESHISEKEKQRIPFWTALTRQDPKSPGSLMFVSLLPELLFQTPLEELGLLFRSIEKHFDKHPSQRDYHPNEAELLLLLKHPEMIDRNPEKVEKLTTCLTSISHFIDNKAELSDQTLKAWGDIGFLTHGFRLWRYDALGDTNSLLAQYGFHPTPSPRSFNEVFGKGFFYEDKASGILFEFRRGYLVASHPNRGTLVIRNSSPAFGRDALRHPAYYLKQPFTVAELMDFDPRGLQDSDSILHRDHYPNQKDNSDWSAHSISFLTDGLIALQRNYQKFKLDTEAFENGFFTGHLSPGLPKMVKALNWMQSKKIPLPDLAFVKPELPPYQPYFYRDADMQKVDRFPLSPSHLQELIDFVSGQWSEQKYLESDWIRFLQKAGVENRGELVMLAPES
jgi:ankyrin repeat protein